jgi:hypothetical protein
LSDEYDGVENAPAIMVSYDHQVSDGRILRFSTGVARDAEPAAINALLDKLTAATDRQAAKYELEKLKETLAQEEKFYTLRQEDLVRIDASAQAEWETSNRKAPWTADKLSATKRQERQQAEIMAQRLRDSIVANRQRVEVLSKAVSGADRATNSH